MATQKIPTAVIIAITITGMILTVTAADLISVNKALPTRGAISAVNVELYSDSQCSQKLTFIDWGIISPGENVTKTIYIKNTGNTQVMLKMTITNWNPQEANGPITLTWNKEDTTLNAGQTVQAVITLIVSSTITGITDFSVDIVVTGMEVG